jgi:DNA modification methylase
MQTNQTSAPTNKVLHGDCISVRQSLPANSIDFILTDPPYLVRYQDRDGRSIQNDSNSDWLVPAFQQCHRVLKQDSFMVSFYGWTQVDRFFTAWRGAGFHIVGHLVFGSRTPRSHASSNISTSRHFCWRRAIRRCREIQLQMSLTRPTPEINFIRHRSL